MNQPERSYQLRSINQSKHICIAPCVANESEALNGRDYRPTPQPAPRGLRPTNVQSQASSETDSELQRRLDSAIQQLSETRQQLLNVEDQLTVARQVTAATQQRQDSYRKECTRIYRRLAATVSMKSCDLIQHKSTSRPSVHAYDTQQQTVQFLSYA